MAFLRKMRYNKSNALYKEKYMEYFLLIVTLLFLATKGYCGKKTSTDIKKPTDPFLFNLIRMLFCLGIGFVLILIEAVSSQLAVPPLFVWITVGAGAANVAFLVGWILAVQRTPMVTMDVALTIGSILPAVLCLILFDEAISVPKLGGFALILVATAILSGYGKSTGKRAGVTGVLLVITASLGEGFSSFCQQLYKHYYTVDGSRAHGVYYENAIFQFYTYVFTAAFLALFFIGASIWNYRKQTEQERTGYVRGLFSSCVRPLPYIAVMAGCLFAANYMQTAITTTYGMSSQVLYPVIKGGSLVLVNITAMLFFGERPTWRSITGSAFALGGAVLMSVL